VDVVTYSVAELSTAVGRTIARAFPDDVWVHGEIRDLSRPPTGHVYFTLVDPDSEAAGTLPVALFAADKEAVNRVLIRSGAVRMTDGIHVRIRGRVVHYAPRGTVQLRMSWIDTDYTVGRLAAQRRALLAALGRSGHVDRNATVPMPMVPVRVGLVTSVGSAAHADFLDELGRSGLGFRVTVVDTRVQGIDAAGSIVAALSYLDRAAVDVVAVVRGGGAQTDLVAFDTEAVAIAIATARHPVLVGVGHEIDTTVADHVAAISLKTPTACAAAVVERVIAFDRRLGEVGHSIGRAAPAAMGRAEVILGALEARAMRSRHTLERHHTTLDRFTRRLVGHSSRLVAQAAADLHAAERRTAGAATGPLAAGTRRLREARRRLPAAARRTLTTHEHTLDALATLRRAVEPERMLAKGWSVTRTDRGRLVRSPDDVSPGDHLRTLTAGGAIASIVHGGGDEETT
jgi:exodeoxyribonuclease VII large subunit